MLLLDQTLAKVQSFLDEIDRLANSEFPYDDSKVAIEQLRVIYDQKLKRLEQFDDMSNIALVSTTCRAAMVSLIEHLPLLGFILRSTNVRNSFDAFGPFLRLAVKLLEPGAEQSQRKTRLLLSSEWRYSPFTHYLISDLPNFVFIGLPAPESSNPLLLPLTGHELGHIVWIQKGAGSKFTTKAFNLAHKQVMKDPGKFKATFNVSLPTNRNSLFASSTWWNAWEWAIKQAAETFCDFIGLRIFGASYVKAFAYLLAPDSGRRSVNYPTLRTRMLNMYKAAEHFAIDVPMETMNMFAETFSSVKLPSEIYLLEIADAVLANMVMDLIKETDAYFTSTGIVSSTHDETSRILRRFENVVPAEKCKSVADILNAAWLAHEDSGLWSSSKELAGRRTMVLRELCLKNLEIFEIEHRLARDLDAAM